MAGMGKGIQEFFRRGKADTKKTIPMESDGRSLKKNLKCKISVTEKLTFNKKGRQRPRGGKRKGEGSTKTNKRRKKHAHLPRDMEKWALELSLSTLDF